MHPDDAIFQAVEASGTDGAVAKAAEASPPTDAKPALGVNEGIKILVRDILSPAHYRTLHQVMSTDWDRLHSLSAAIKLMEQYGVQLTQQERDRIASLPEDKQITSLVMKMPQQSNEQFQHFFLQLQLLVSTATRVRKALEDGRPDLVEESLNEAESTGMAQYIIKMAVVQAGSEVATLKRQFEAWIKEADSKMGKLVRGQEDAMQAQKRLAAARAQLTAYNSSQNEKAKKVLMSFTSNSGTALMASSFQGWLAVYKQGKQEAHIRAEYEERIAFARQRLLDYKTTQLSNVRGIMEKKAKDQDGMLVGEAMKLWRDVIEHEKDLAENAGKVSELESKLQQLKQSQAEKSRKVMARMNADNDKTLMGLALQAWQSFCVEYKHNKEMEDAVKAKAQQVEQLLKSQKEGAKKVLGGLAASSTSGLIASTFEGWKQVAIDAKEEARIAEALHGINSRFEEFGARNKQGARSVLERARVHMDSMLLLKTWQCWQMDCRVETSLRYYQKMIDAKRQQLIGVQQMFRGFATNLETRMKDGTDTLRDFKDGPTLGRKRMQKSEGTCSLPDINQRGGSGRTPKSSPKLATPKSGGNRVRTPSSGRVSGDPGQSPAPPPRSAWT